MYTDQLSSGKFVRIGRHRVSISDHRALPLIYEDKKKTTLSPFYRHIDESFQCQEDDLKHGCRRARFASALEKYEAVCPHESEAVTELIDGCILEMLMQTPDLEGWRDVCLNDFVLDLVFKVCADREDVERFRKKHLTPTLYHVTHRL